AAGPRVGHDSAEALAGLDGRQRLASPIDRFKAHGARALIFAAMGNAAAAQKHAREAVLAAAAIQSPFRYHRTLGLVGDLHVEQLVELKRLAAEQRVEADKARER